MVDLERIQRYLNRQHVLLQFGSAEGNFRLARSLRRILDDPEGVADDENLARFRAFCELVDKTALGTSESQAARSLVTLEFVVRMEREARRRRLTDS